MRFKTVWDALGPFKIGGVACSASVQPSPVTGEPLPFFSRYYCEGSAGVDMLAQDVAILPGTRTPAVEFASPAPVMVGHVVQHLLEFRVRGALLLPLLVPSPAAGHGSLGGDHPRGTGAFFHWPSSTGSLNAWCYRRWAMRAVGVGFSRVQSF